jgi:hypothetical protein
MPALLFVGFLFCFGLAFWAGFGLAGWWLLGRMGLELEWNPLSAASRAARAERRGRYGDALRWYARAARGERLVTANLRYGLPSWPVRAVLIEVGCELVRLERGTLLAHAVGVPEAMTRAIAAEAEGAADVFWRSAERIGAAAQQVDALRFNLGLAPGLAPELGREMLHLGELLDAVRALRDELAALTLTGTRGSVERDEARYLYLRLQALADVARGLTEQQRAAAA